MNPNILNRLREINEEKADKELADSRHTQLLNETIEVQNAIVKSISTLIKYLDNKTTKTEVVNQLTEIGTPDALKVVESVNSLHDTLKTHENTDLTEVTSILKDVLAEAKQLPKEKVDITIPEQKDYVAQFKELTKAINSVEKVVKGQKLVAEAPIVNVPETKVNVEAPNLKPLETSISSGSKEVVKAVKGIKIPETDLSPVEKLLKKTNKLLEELPEYMPSGGGSGSSWPAVNSEGLAQPLTIDDNGALQITGSITASASTLADYSVNDMTDTYFGFTKPDGTWLLKKVLDTSVGYATVSNNGTVTSYTDAWTNKATLTYERFDEAF